MFWVRVWATHSIFMRETNDFSLGSLDPCPICHYIHFHMIYVHTLMQVDHHSHFYLFAFFYLYFIPLFHSTSSDSFFFLILLDVWLKFNIHILFLLIRCVHSFIITFCVGILRSATHEVFSTHCISCMKGMRIISLRFFSLVSFHFFHLISLAYVTSRVLRPPWNHDFTHCTWQLTHGQYSRLVGDYFLEHDGWGVGVTIYTRAYPSYQWWIFKGDVIYSKVYSTHRW